MSKQLEFMPCEFCKGDCLYAELSVKTVRTYANGEVYCTQHVLTCTNEKICRMQRANCKTDVAHPPASGLCKATEILGLGKKTMHGKNLTF